MAITKILARDYTFELNTGTTETPTWVEVLGIDTWSHSPQSTDADTTTFEDDGRQSHLKASRGDEFGLQGKVLIDVADGTRDPGQEACEAWGSEVSTLSLKEFRITDPGGNTNEFLASATVTKGGGGNDAASAWECAMKVSGAITYTAAA